MAWTVREFGDGESDNHLWRQIMEPNLRASRAFEIHCWEDERQEIRMALKYGVPRETNWKLGTVIAGDVTPEFIQFLLSLPKPADSGAESKMTPFFSIFLDNGFSSEHYGTELNQEPD